MDKRKPYKIPFIGLKKGVHQFHYDIDDDFFALFENAVVKGSKVTVDLTFDKKEDFFILDFYIGGTIEVECDRCMQQFDQELLDEFRVYVKFDEELRGEEDEDVIYISPSDTHLDVSQLIYEFINLSIPVQKICPPNKAGAPSCDEEVLKILNFKEKKAPKEMDQRWAALKKLK